MDIAISIFIGVLTGVLSAILIAFSNNIYKSIILPWFQSKVYQGVLIEGHWKGYMQINSVKWDMSLSIKQKGNRVSGILLAKSTDPNAKKKETDMKITEIMGMDAEQFTQIAMIAQGDFLKLLHAESKERRKIFSRIFHTKYGSCLRSQVRYNTRNGHRFCRPIQGTPSFRPWCGRKACNIPFDREWTFLCRNNRSDRPRYQKTYPIR